MKNLRTWFTLLGALVLVLALASTASAQATRTWVSGVGDDANPCSRTAPCKTFAGAISKTANGGEIDCLDPGGFGAVTITKSITIDCDSGPGGVLSSGTQGIIINANPASDTIVLRSLNINGAGVTLGTNGINIIAAKAVHLYDVNIQNYSSNGVVTGVTSTLLLTMQDVRIHECANGVTLSASGGGVVVAADFEHVAIWDATNGVSAQNGTRLNVHNSTFFANGVGINQSNLSGTGSLVAAFNSTFSLNTTGLQSIGGASAFTSASFYAENGTAINTNGGTICSGGNNAVFQNGSNGSPSGGCPASSI